MIDNHKIWLFLPPNTCHFVIASFFFDWVCMPLLWHRCPENVAIPYVSRRHELRAPTPRGHECSRTFNSFMASSHTLHDAVATRGNILRQRGTHVRFSAVVRRRRPRWSTFQVQNRLKGTDSKVQSGLSSRTSCTGRTSRQVIMWIPQSPIRRISWLMQNLPHCCCPPHESLHSTSNSWIYDVGCPCSVILLTEALIPLERGVWPLHTFISNFSMRGFGCLIRDACNPSCFIFFEPLWS